MRCHVRKWCQRQNELLIVWETRPTLKTSKEREGEDKDEEDRRDNVKKGSGYH